MKRTEIAEIGGEFALINRIHAKTAARREDTLKGIGDDAAVLQLPDGLQLISTDLLLEGVHFDLAYVPFKHLGYKAVAVNVSDIAAMNGLPTHVTISLGLSNRIPVEAVEEFYVGAQLACEAYGVDLVGGDTASSRGGLVISVSVLGRVATNAVAYRNGAKANEVLCVTGDLGAAYMGLQVLEREKQVFLANPDMQPDIEKYEYVVGRQLKPEARLDIVHELREKGVIPTSMIDISDGLASEALHLCQQSGLGVRIFEENLPIEDATMLAATDFKVNPITAALNGGEDYELLMTIRQEDFEKVKTITEITPIGFMTAEPGAYLVLNSGDLAIITAQGWQHLNQQQ